MSKIVWKGSDTVILSTQIEIYCDTKGLSIVGYYHANERADDTTVSETAIITANKIAGNCDKACLLMVSL